MLGGVVWLALVGACVISGLCGAMIPLTLKRFGLDPATASSIFLTTATDVVSMGMLLGLATILFDARDRSAAACHGQKRKHRPPDADGLTAEVTTN